MDVDYGPLLEDHHSFHNIHALNTKIRTLECSSVSLIDFCHSKTSYLTKGTKTAAVIYDNFASLAVK